MPLSVEDQKFPYRGPRSFYNILCTTPVWVWHRMAPAASFDGTAPSSATKSAAEYDPEVSAGMANFASLTHGGLFTMLGNHKRPIVIENVINPGGLVLQAVDRAGTVLRTLSGALPYKLAANETLKVTGGAAGAAIGVMVRIDETKII